MRAALALHSSRAGGTMKKFPRKEVLDKQFAVVAEELEKEKLEGVQGGSGFGSAASTLMRSSIVYGVGLPILNQFRRWLGGGSNQGGSTPQ